MVKKDKSKEGQGNRKEVDITTARQAKLTEHL